MERVDLILSKLANILQDVLNDDALTVTLASVAQDYDGWDSLAHIRLIVSIEKAFSIKFSASEIASLKNVGEMVTLIAAKTTVV